MTITIVIPCFNEEGAIFETVRDVQAAFAGTDFEVLVVDDGSTDASPQILHTLAAESPRVRVLTQPANRGYGAALKAGIRKAHGTWIGITDADGSYPTDQLPLLLDMAQTQEADMVVGARTGPDVTYSRIRRLPKAVLRQWTNWLTRTSIPDINSGLRVFRRDVALRFLTLLPDTFSFTTTITIASLTSGLTVLFHPVNYRPRIGRSKIQPVRDTLRFLQLITRTGMYFAPLRVLGPVIGLLLLAFLGSLTYDAVVLSNLTDKTVILLMFCLNTTIFALLADMIDKRRG